MRLNIDNLKNYKTSLQMPSIYRCYGMDYNQDGEKDPWDIEDCVGIIAKFMHENGWERSGQVAILAEHQSEQYKELKTGYKHRYMLSTLNRYGITPASPFRESSTSLIKLRDRTLDKLWLGAKNFNVLTRYNASSNYGMAIHIIAQSVR